MTNAEWLIENKISFQSINIYIDVLIFILIISLI